jgi:hypothetical protein
MKDIAIKNMDIDSINNKNMITGLTGTYSDRVEMYQQKIKPDIFIDYLITLQIFHRLKIKGEGIEWITLRGVNKLLTKFPLKGYKHIRKQISFWSLFRIILLNFKYGKYKNKKINLGYL